MATAKVFWSGNSQAVRLPREFRFTTEEVEIYRRDGEVILREVPRGMQHALELISQLPPEIDDRDDPFPQGRDGL